MTTFLIRRLWASALTIVVVVVLNFVLINAAPGDPVVMMGGLDNPNPDVIAALQARYGLDRPYLARLWSYLAGLAQGDLGRSISFDKPVSGLIADTIGPTLLLTLTGTIAAFVGGVALGTLSAIRQGSRLDHGLSFVTYALYAMPAFWLGLMLILVFNGWLKWLPTSGMTNVRNPQVGLAHALDVGKHLILPALTLALVQLPVFYRITRASVAQVLREDFVVTLRAAGLTSGQIFRKYALKNALLPAITVLGLQLGYVVAGAALIEIVFAWPGMGRMTLNAVFRRDYPLLMGIYLVISVSVAIASLVTDLIYAWLDPRIRYS